MGFQIAEEGWEETVAYLRAREQVTSVYVERRKPILLTQSRSTVEAVTYVVNRQHRQYAGILKDEALLAHVIRGEGVSGRCVDYVMNTVKHLREMKIHDPTLERIARNLDVQAASSSS